MAPDAKRRSWRAKLALALASLALTAVAAEIAARIALGGRFVQGEIRDVSWAACARHDPDYGWSNRPLARVHVANGRVDYHVRINSAGFRDPERTEVPAPGVRRVLLLGDSMSWGWGVEQGERFSDLLEQRLGPGVEVVNLAVPGYGTDQQLWLLEEKGLRYEPDVVLLGFVLNDVVDAQRKYRYNMFKPRYVRAPDGTWSLENRPAPLPYGRGQMLVREAWRAWSARSALVAWARSLGAKPPEDLEVEPARDENGEELAYVMPVNVGADKVDAFCDKIVEADSVTRMLLGRLAETCRANGLPFLAFSMPHNHDQYLYNPGAKPPEGVTDPESRLAQRLREVGIALGFETLSIDRDLFAVARTGTNLDCGDGHYNAAGNRVVADALEPVLREMLAGSRALGK